MTIELAGVSNAWRKLFRQSKKHLRLNLFATNACLLQSLSLWHRRYDELRFIDVNELKCGPKMELMAYQDVMYHKVEDVKKTLREQWLKQLADVYRCCQKKKQLPSEAKIPAFLRFVF